MKEICSCGFVRRGKNHDKGQHHNRQRNVVTGAKQKAKELHTALHGMKRNVGNPSKHEKGCSCYACRKKP